MKEVSKASGFSFRVSTAILRLLGEELNPHPDQGINELVRNSYDADATLCRVELDNVGAPGGSIRIFDNGHGLTVNDIRDGWLLLGESNKHSTSRTPKGRTPVGNKGIGRLAALRLGRSVVLKTTPENSDEKNIVTIDWSLFDAAQAVEDVPLDVIQEPVKPNLEQHRTEIQINDLRAKIGRVDIKRIARNLILLSDPFNDESGFRTELATKEFQDLEALVQAKYFDEAEYKLIAEIEGDGLATVEVVDFQGNVIFKGDHQQLRHKRTRKGLHPPYKTIPARFEFWAFLLSEQKFSGKTATVKEVKEWLKHVGGVHIYHRGLRVLPYGDPGQDWLDINLRRSASPEERPPTNNSIGRLIVPDAGGILIQPTDRSGFLETEQFSELKEFCKESLDFMARHRVRLRDKRKSEQKKAHPKKVRSAKSKVVQVLDELPDDKKDAAKDAFQQYEASRDVELEEKVDDLLLYRALGTVGTTAAAFAHEARNPLLRIRDNADIVERRINTDIPKLFNKRYRSPLGLIRKAADYLQIFSDTTLSLLRRDKRRRSVLDVNATISDLAKTFRPLILDSNLEFLSVLDPSGPRILGQAAALEAILANLTTNAVNAFVFAKQPSAQRLISVNTILRAGMVTIDFADSGPGLQDIESDDIWVAGESTTPEGTGLGLTIVRDTVFDLGGEIEVVPAGRIGGAQFLITLPSLED